MTERNLPRRSSVRIRSKDQYYIHLYFLLRDIEQALKEHACGRLLDIGCGNKPYAVWYEPLTEESVGCDMVQSDQFKVDVLCPATALALPDNHFDTALCTQVLEHVYDHHAVVREACRVLKPGGKLVLTVPFCWELHEEPHDYFRLSRHGLRQLFEENGLTVLTLKANGGKWAAALQMLINTVYSGFRKKTLRSKIIKFVFMELRLGQLINKLAVGADKIYFDEVWTLNYLIVGEKKS